MVETEGGGAKALFARLLLLVLNVALFGLGIALAAGREKNKRKRVVVSDDEEED